MLKSLLPKLQCPTCTSRDSVLTLNVFEDRSAERVKDGVLVCEACRAWYPIEDGVLELAVSSLLDAEDVNRFRARFRNRFDALRLADRPVTHSHDDNDPLLKQRHHFDWYAENDEQAYSAYQRTPFWMAADAEAYARWLPRVSPTDWLLDLGCADGRSAFPFVNKCTVIGFDISKKMVRKATERARQAGAEDTTCFIVADATRLPFRDESFDFTLTYGVLHHLPDPKSGMHEIIRVLKDGGQHFGSENNESVFRVIFDKMMKFKPLWIEEAGAEPLISHRMIQDWTNGHPVKVKWWTSVFLPPHLFNLIGSDAARWTLSVTDRLGGIIPALRGQGGLIVFEVTKVAAAPVPAAV